MKVDRILEIIIYLLNHETVQARLLAERFEVSVRTIQRDMISISRIGIPVYALGGKKGGYSILSNYKMKNAGIGKEEQQMIIQALESLATSYTNQTLENLIEKYNAMIEKEGGQKIFWDFSVSKENRQVQEYNKQLEQASMARKLVSFTYCNVSGKKSEQFVEPLAIHYKWYAWYLFAYSENHKEYRTYKVARIQNLQCLERTSKFVHRDVKTLMQEAEDAYYNTCISIEVQFHEDALELVKEYFPDCLPEKQHDCNYRIFITVPAKERLWKALLLSFGNRVKIIAPDSYKEELIQTAKDFISNYEFPS